MFNEVGECWGGPLQIYIDDGLISGPTTRNSQPHSLKGGCRNFFHTNMIHRIEMVGPENSVA